MVYYFDELRAVTDKNYYKVQKYASKERIEYANRYKFHNDKVQSIMVYLLLRFGLDKELDLKIKPSILYDNMGKPYIKELTDTFINLSHCTKGVACAISNKKVGIDIQEFCEFEQDIALMFMDELELKTCMSSKSNKEYTRIWALKESFGKYHGYGICYDMNKINIIENALKEGVFSYSFTYEQFVLAISAEEYLPVRKVTFHELLKCFA